MFKKIFWFLLGAGVGVFALMKAKKYLQQTTPEAIGGRLAESISGLGESIHDFSAEVRAAMAERETELRDTLGLAPDDQ